MKKFVYLFPLTSKIEWSGETEDSLRRRTLKDEMTHSIDVFLTTAKIGHFIILDTGEYIFRTE